MTLDEQPDDGIPEDLRVVMDAEFEIEGGKATDLPDLQAALSSTSGVESSNFGDGSLLIRYDPEQVTKAELVEMIQRAGFRVAKAEADSAEPHIEIPFESSSSSSSESTR